MQAIVFLLAKEQPGISLRIFAEFLQQVLGIPIVVVGEIAFELMVGFVLLWHPIGNLEPQPVPDKCIELFLAALSEQTLERMPVTLVKLGLLVVGKRHKNVVTNEVNRRERLTLGVHGLKYELGIINASGELSVDDLHTV